MSVTPDARTSTYLLPNYPLPNYYPTIPPSTTTVLPVT